MPIKVPNDLPAVDTLLKENVFVMTDTRAMTQDIRPLRILLLNLMPTKIDTETQLTRLLGNSPLQVELELLQVSTHKSKNTSEEHMIAFYKTFDAVKDENFDGMIITGAPVELYDFEDVDYWEELCEIMEWTKTHVHCTFFICWGAQAGMYYFYGINKYKLPEKLSGVYKHHLDVKNGMLFRGFDDEFYVPHSRNTDIRREDIEKVPELKIICSSDEAGVFCVKSINDRQIFVFGHSEYDADTLKKEYERDKKAGINPNVPANYFPDDDDTKDPIVRWRSCANLLYSNWLNYFVYQSTPYDIKRINEEDLDSAITIDAKLKVAKFGGSSLATAEAFRNAAELVKADPARRYVVVSAPGKRKPGDPKMTDLLIDAYEADTEEIFNEKIDAVRDHFTEIAEGLGVDTPVARMIEKIRADKKAGAGLEYMMSRGEYISAQIMARYLGYDFVDAADIFVFDANGGYDRNATRKKVHNVLAKHKKAVIPGFYGSDADGNVHTFSRGGSDITGAIVAEAVKAGLYEKWTDVPGLLMADPRLVDDPLPVPIVTYKELRELALMGFNVLHEDTVFPVRRVGIPVNIRSTIEPDAPGTMIVQSADHYRNVLDISGVTARSGFARILIEKPKLNENIDFRGRVIQIAKDHEIKVFNIDSGIDTMSLIVRSDSIKGKEQAIIDAIEKGAGASSARIIGGLALLTVVGRNMERTPSISVRIFDALAKSGVNISFIDQGSSRISVTIGVSDEDYLLAVRAIYSEFTKA